MKIYIDIETVPGIEAGGQLADEIKEAAGARYVKEDIILKHQKEAYDRLALRPFFANPVCICAHTDAEKFEMVGEPDSLLYEFSGWLSNLNGYDTYFCGYNIVKFDLPVLAAAMVRWRYPVPTVLSAALDQPYKQVDYYRMFPDAGKFGQVGELLGVPKHTKKDGGDVKSLWDASEWGDIKAHCQDDIRILKRIGEYI